MSRAIGDFNFFIFRDDYLSGARISIQNFQKAIANSG